MGSNSNKGVASPDEGINLGYSVELDFKYDMDKEFRRPGYAHGPRGYAGPSCGGYEGGFTGGRIGGARAVNKNDSLSAQADGPHEYMGSGTNEDGFFVGGEGSVGEAEAHAGPFGLGVQGPAVGGTLQAGNKGLRIHGVAKAVSGNVDVGPVKLGAGVGLKGTLRAGYGGVGAIVPGVGSAVVAKDGLDLSIGVFNFKIGW